MNEPFAHSDPLTIDEMVKLQRAAGPVAHIKGPLSPSAREAVCSTLANEATQVENFTVESFRMQTIDVGPGRRVVMYEIEYVYDDD